MTESALFRSYWDDGLLDLLWGSGLLMTGLAWEASLGPLAAMQAPLWIVLWRPLRKRIVEPRAGYVRFALSRRTRTHRELSWVLALGVGALLALLLLVTLLGTRGSGVTLSRLVQGFPALLVALGAAITGLLTGARRFHVYGLGLVIGAVGAIALSRGPAPPLTAMGLVIVAAGASLLFRFVHDSRDNQEPPQS